MVGTQASETGLLHLSKLILTHVDDVLQVLESHYCL